MAITTTPIGVLGREGYFFATSAPATYRLPPSPRGLTILLARWSGSGNIYYDVLNSKTGARIGGSNKDTTAAVTEVSPESAVDGVDLVIGNSTEVRICIAYGYKNTPPIA